MPRPRAIFKPRSKGSRILSRRMSWALNSCSVDFAKTTLLDIQTQRHREIEYLARYFPAD
jgi:hypothetical protein